MRPSRPSIVSKESAAAARKPATSASAPVTVTPAGEAGRTLILDTAARLFRDKGYAATSLRDIAGACGMKAGSLYYHFDSKDAIITEVLRIGVAHVFDAIRSAVDALGPDAEPRVVLETAITAHLRALLQSEDYTSANIRIFGQVPPEVRAEHLPLRQSYEKYWTDLLKRCALQGAFRPGCDLHFARLFLLGAMNSALEWFQPNRASVDEISAELTAVFFDGLAVRESIVPPRAKSRRRAG